jgi:hypothetical protein
MAASMTLHLVLLGLARREQADVYALDGIAEMKLNQPYPWSKFIELSMSPLHGQGSASKPPTGVALVQPKLT